MRKMVRCTHSWRKRLIYIFATFFCEAIGARTACPMLFKGDGNR